MNSRVKKSGPRRREDLNVAHYQLMHGIDFDPPTIRNQKHEVSSDWDPSSSSDDARMKSHSKTSSGQRRHSVTVSFAEPPAASAHKPYRRKTISGCQSQSTSPRQSIFKRFTSYEDLNIAHHQLMCGIDSQSQKYQKQKVSDLDPSTSPEVSVSFAQPPATTAQNPNLRRSI